MYTEANSRLYRRETCKQANLKNSYEQNLPKKSTIDGYLGLRSLKNGALDNFLCCLSAVLKTNFFLIADEVQKVHCQKMRAYSHLSLLVNMWHFYVTKSSLWSKTRPSILCWAGPGVGKGWKGGGECGQK
jgi:hypothetical protein